MEQNPFQSSSLTAANARTEIGILGTEGFGDDELFEEVRKGGRFIVYDYCISVIYITFKKTTKVYFVRAGEGRFGRGLNWSLFTLLTGPWGIPFGPIFTFWSIAQNLCGRRDITPEVAEKMLGWGSSRIRIIDELR